MTPSRSAASPAWLSARAEIAADLHIAGEVTLDELDRVTVDAINGTYTGPLVYANGRVARDDDYLFRRSDD